MRPCGLEGAWGEGRGGDEIMLEALLYGRKTDFSHCIATDVRCLMGQATCKVDVSDSYAFL